VASLEGTTWGLDVSTSPKKTAAVALAWSGEAATVITIRHPLTAEGVVELMAKHRDDQWAVDVPFGWPDRFVAFMADRRDGPLPQCLLPEVSTWNTWRTAEVARRRTDQYLLNHKQVRTRPLPASFDRLGATAAMWALIESRLAVEGVTIDRSGVTGRVCETYPRAAQAAWAHRDFAKPTLAELKRMFPFLHVPGEFVPLLATDDVRDAVVCAVVARARQLGLTLQPPDKCMEAARREGWIHVSVEPIASLTPIIRPDASEGRGKA